LVRGILDRESGFLVLSLSKDIQHSGAYAWER
jgi:hypothetical protein